MRKRDVGSSSWGSLEAPTWRTLLVELPTWSFSAAASAKQLLQKTMFKVGRRKRNGQGIHKVSHCNLMGLVLMGHLYKRTFSDFFKRPQVELESHGSEPWIEAHSVFWFRPRLVKKSVVWGDKIFWMSEWVCSAICRVQEYGCIAGNLDDKTAQFIQNQLILHFVGTKWRILQNGTTCSYK